MTRYVKSGTVNTVQEINSELEKIAESLGEALTRDGSVPNEMKVTLDMNGNRVINLPSPSLPNDIIRLRDIDGLLDGAQIITKLPPLVREDVTLTVSQTSVSFSNTEGASSALYLSGPSVDSTRLHEGIDYTVDSETGLYSIILLQSYPVGSVITAYSYDTSGSVVAADTSSFGAYTLKDLLELSYKEELGISSWAHRGLMGYAPENTLAAVYNALTKGHIAVEGDVAWTTDNVPVIFHDTTVDRTTDGTGNVYDKTLAELKALDAGSWFSSVYAGEEIPTFEEWFNAITFLGGIPLIEIKEQTGSTETNIKAMAQWCKDNRRDNKYAFLVRVPDTFNWVREINPQANMVYYPNTGEPSTVNADFVQSKGNCSLHLSAEYVTNFDFNGYTFPITALNRPYTQDLRLAGTRGFKAIGTDYYVGSHS